VAQQHLQVVGFAVYGVTPYVPGDPKRFRTRNIEKVLLVDDTLVFPNKRLFNNRVLPVIL
jgi:hypothetical protein